MQAIVTISYTHGLRDDDNHVTVTESSYYRAGSGAGEIAEAVEGATRRALARAKATINADA